MVVLMESIRMFFMFIGYGKHNERKWRATLMRRQGTQGLKKRSSFETKYLVFDVLFHEWIFLWLIGIKNTIEQACFKVFGLMG
jgi:hypothetical protein